MLFKIWLPDFSCGTGLIFWLSSRHLLMSPLVRMIGMSWLFSARRWGDTAGVAGALLRLAVLFPDDRLSMVWPFFRNECDDEF